MTLLGVRAKNHPQQVGRRGADDSADDRRTPDALWLPLNEEFQFTLDVAASAENAKTLLRYFTPEHDGLVQPWSGRVWCNPPYSDLRPWVAKAWKAHLAGCPLIVMLVPANRTEQGWWQDLVEPNRDKGQGFSVRFLRGRQRFNRPGWTKPAKGDRPPFGCCLLIWTGSASEYVTPSPRYERGLTFERQGNHIVVGEPRPLPVSPAHPTGHS